MGEPLTFSGVIPANILPFDTDYSIDEADYRRHLRWLAGVQGVTGIAVNGHAAEVSSLSRQERRRALAIALDEVGARLPLVAGIYTDSTQEAVELARDAKAEGARGLLVFPPSLFMWGVQLRPEMAVRHFAMIAEAVALPLVVFQYPVASGLGYAPDTLVRLVEISQVVAVKEWSNDIVAFEQNLRAIRATGLRAVELYDVSARQLRPGRRWGDLGPGQRRRRPPGRAVCRRAARGSRGGAAGE